MQQEFVRILGLWTQEKGPLYQRLAIALRRAIGTTEIPAGTLLPSERAMAQELGVSRNTVVAAYSELVADGWVERRHGSGTRVCQISGSRSAQLRSVQIGKLARGTIYDAFLAEHVEPIDLATGALAWPNGIPLQPYLPTTDDLSPLIQEYGYLPQGFLPLRQAIAHYFIQRGVPTTIDQILVTTGAQQAIQLILACFLQRGDAILLEIPTFFGALEVCRSLGLHCCTVPIGRDGLDLSLVEQQFATGNVRWFFVQPTLQNPTGSDLSPTQRHLLVQLAEQYNVTIIEDLTMADLRWAMPPLAPLASFASQDHIITLGSLSKSVWGGMRIGWLRASTEVMARLVRFKSINDLGSSALSQVMAVRLLASLDIFLVQRRSELRERLECMETYLTHHLPTWTWQHPGGGIFLWVKLPCGDAREFTQEALRHDVLITPGPMLSMNDENTSYIRLSCLWPPEKLIRALEKLEQAWRHYEARLDKQHTTFPVIV